MAPLTPREAQIARLAATGMTNAQIARRIGISFHTCKTHVHSALVKTGAPNRTALAAVIARAA